MLTWASKGARTSCQPVANSMSLKSFPKRTCTIELGFSRKGKRIPASEVVTGVPMPASMSSTAPPRAASAGGGAGAAASSATRSSKTGSSGPIGVSASATAPPSTRKCPRGITSGWFVLPCAASALATRMRFLTVSSQLRLQLQRDSTSPRTVRGELRRPSCTRAELSTGTSDSAVSMRGPKTGCTFEAMSTTMGFTSLLTNWPTFTCRSATPKASGSVVSPGPASQPEGMSSNLKSRRPCRDGKSWLAAPAFTPVSKSRCASARASKPISERSRPVRICSPAKRPAGGTRPRPT